MSDEPQGDGATSASISEAERQAFYDTANEFLDPANSLIGVEPIDELAAAFLYACARYNSFAMQALAEDPSAIDEATVEYLATEFERHLGDHMREQLRSGPSGPDDPDGSPRQVVDVISGLADRDEDELSDFLDLGDRFIAVANRLIRTERVGRISAAFMHACARFNVYAMQSLGHPPGEVDEDLIELYREAYVNLVDYHLQETLIRPQD